jgi:flagellar M-ring protein FliF
VQAPIASVGQPINTSKNSTINYEVDKTIRHVRQSVGTIKRLSAPWWSISARKSARTASDSKPLPDAELKQISDLVKEAMGFSKDRGDTISVANAPFTVLEKDDGLPLWRDPKWSPWPRICSSMARIAASSPICCSASCGPCSRPCSNRRQASERASVARSICWPRKRAKGEPGERPDAAELLEKKLAEARALAQQDPQIVANIIKEWTGANAS